MSTSQTDTADARRPLRALVVEDDTADAELLQVALEWSGYDLTTRVVATEADLRSALEEPWDVVISDYVLPGFSGIEAVRMVRARHDAPPVILVSGTIGEEVAVEALREGAADYLLKDRLARLPAAIDTAIERHRLTGERERIRQRLVDQENLSQAVLASLQSHIAVLDAEGCVIAVNDAWHRFSAEGALEGTASVGGSYLEMLRRCAADPDIADAGRQALDGVEEVLAGTRQSFLLEYPHHGAEGVRWFSMHVVPLSDDRGGAVVSLEDVSERVRGESERRLNALAMQNMSEGLMVLDHRLNLISVNEAFTRITGFTADEARGGYPVQWLRTGNSRALLRRIEDALRDEGRWEGEYACQRKDSEWYTELVRVRRVVDLADQLPYYVAVFDDVTAMREYEDRLEYLAHYDELTGLPNTRFFIDCLDEALARAREQHQAVAVLYLRFNETRVISDTLGHNVGDGLLSEVGRRLAAMPEISRACGRMGDAAFAVFVEACAGAEAALELARKVQALFADAVRVDGNLLFPRVFVGVSLFDGDQGNAEQLVREADMALFDAVDAPYGVQVFTPELAERLQGNLDMARLLRDAIARDELRVVYQPRYALGSGRLCSVEALLRWQNEELGNVAPDRFIPVAEETGLVLELGMWVIRSVCAQMQAWARQGVAVPRAAINLSAVQFREPDFAEHVLETVRSHGIPPGHIEFEITEGTLIDSQGDFERELLKLREAGFLFAIDDFGTGYSSLAYLKKIAATTLKVDKTFVDHLPGDNEDYQIVAAVHAIARSLGMTVVAEGVERREQEACLVELGCDEVQGYLYSPPVEAEAVESLLVDPVNARLL